MPRFSTIIPLYNKESYVAKAIYSVLSQTFCDYELIIVDDGSTDNSAEIALQSISGHCNCHLIRQKNAGVSETRNNGVSESCGEYICFLDADDWWDPTFLEEMNSLITRHPGAGIYGTGYNLVKNGRTRIAPIGISDGFTEGAINYCNVYARTLCMPLWTGAICLPRTIFDEMRGFKPKLKLGEDFDLWIRIALKYHVILLNKPLSNYNQDVDTASRGIGKLYSPQNHFLWNLEYLDWEERINHDYKILIDRLRVYGLKPYYISREYHEAAVAALSIVDWDNQSSHDRNYYRSPLWLIRFHHKIMLIGYTIKSRIRKIV